MPSLSGLPVFPSAGPLTLALSRNGERGLLGTPRNSPLFHVGEREL